VGRALKLGLETLAHALGGAVKVGSEYRCLCPAHDDHRPSLSLTEKSGRLLVICRAGCDQSRVIQKLRERGLWGGNHQVISPGSRPSGDYQPDRDEARRSEIARHVWDLSRPGTASLVEVYLRSRGITMSVPPVLRFAPSLKHPSRVFLPAMVAAVQNFEGRVVAIHRTFLQPDGSGKADLEPAKAALGPIRRCAVHLAQAGATLAIAEGIETALSVLQSTGLPTWAALGTANLSSVALPATVREVLIAADGDKPGERAAQAAAQRLVREGRGVRIMRPSAGLDFNDVLRGGAADEQ